jgi:hypothetical protein
MKTYNLFSDTKNFLDKVAPYVYEFSGHKCFDGIVQEKDDIYWDEIASFMNELQYKGMGQIRLYCDVQHPYFEFNNDIFDNTYYRDEKYIYKF